MSWLPFPLSAAVRTRRLPDGAVHTAQYHHVGQAADSEQFIWDWHPVSSNFFFSNMWFLWCVQHTVYLWPLDMKMVPAKPLQWASVCPIANTSSLLFCRCTNVTAITSSNACVWKELGNLQFSYLLVVGIILNMWFNHNHVSLILPFSISWHSCSFYESRYRAQCVCWHSVLVTPYPSEK